MSVGTMMSPISALAGEALSAHRLVKMHASTARTVQYADSGDRAIGVVPVDAASGDSVAVSLLHGGAVLKVIAAGAITAGSTIYTANDGKVSDSVSGDPIGQAFTASGANGDALLLVPFGMAGGDVDSDLVTFGDDFGDFVNADFWTTDANNGGSVVENDAHGGTVTLTASDTTDADNDESYLLSTNEIYKPAAGKRAVLKARVKLTEANTDDANIIFGLTSTGVDAENLIADGGATLEDSATHIIISKSDGGTKWKGTLRDTALDEDSDIGDFDDGAWTELKIVVDSPSSADTVATVTFYVDGVAGGTKDFLLSSAAEMRVVFGVKNGGGSAQALGEQLQIDKFFMQFDR